MTKSIGVLLGAVLMLLAGSAYALAQDPDNAGNDRFLDRDRLVRTLIEGEKRAFDAAMLVAGVTGGQLAEAEADLKVLQSEIIDLPDGSAEQAEATARVDALTRRIETQLRPAAQTADIQLDVARATLRDEQALVRAQVRDLPEFVVMAFNRALDDAVRQGLVVNIGSHHIQLVLDGRFDRRQIHALGRALVEEARYVKRSETMAETDNADNQNTGRNNGLTIQSLDDDAIERP